MIVTLPWPPSVLHPNSRPHHMQRASAAKTYRTQAYWLAKAAQDMLPEDASEIMLNVSFRPPDRRRRDLDGMLSAIKSGIDGIADALAVNDHRFAFTIRRIEPTKNGSVVISIGGAE